jgi:hypothetical protein
MIRQSMILLTTFLVVGTLVPLNGQAKSKQISPAFSEAGLTNKDILGMVKAGLSPDVIIAKIQTSACSFDTSPTALEKLKAAGVPETVILTMVKAPNAGTSNEVPAHSAPLVQPQTASPQAPKPVEPLAQTPSLTGQAIAQDTKAVVHFYRERAFQASLRKIPINIDEVKIANLVNGRQFTIRLDPGKHIIRSKSKLKAISVNMKPGKEYYFRAEFSQGFWKNEWLIVQVANEQGAADIQRLKPLDLKDIAPLESPAESK